MSSWHISSMGEDRGGDWRVAVNHGVMESLGVDKETLSITAIVAAFPFAVLGFLKYNGMTAEKFIAAWVKSTFIIPKVLTFGNTNYYYKTLVEEKPDTGKKRTFHRRGGRQKRKKIIKQNKDNTNTKAKGK